MPVVTVEALIPDDASRVDALLATIPLALSAALSCPSADVWVYWKPVAAAKSGDEVRRYRGHSPIVTVRARAWRSEEQVRAGLAATAQAVSTALGLPLDDVWVHWLEVPPGRVYAGGGIR